jgi:superfamily I DNA/RNA helicase
MVIIGRHTMSRSPFNELSDDIKVINDYDQWRNGEGIFYSTYYSFKGLEADIVYLVEVIDSCDKFPESLYINGLGRARWKSMVVKVKS